MTVGVGVGCSVGVGVKVAVGVGVADGATVTVTDGMGGVTVGVMTSHLFGLQLAPVSRQALKAHFP